MRRFCFSEEVLGEFISGCLPEEERPAVEKHIAECEKCRTLVSEAHQAMCTPDMSEIMYKAVGGIRKNTWLISAVIFLLFSFFLHRYFFQFLLASFISGSKWIVDSRNTKTVIMVHDGDKTFRPAPPKKISRNEK